MTDRDSALMLLVNRERVSLAQREILGPYVTRDEIAATILRLLRVHRRFPTTADDGPCLRVTADGRTELVRHRPALRVTFEQSLAAVDRYLALELGPSIGGVRVR